MLLSYDALQLACARINSPEGQDYLCAMACAANYAWVNRAAMTFLTRQVRWLSAYWAHLSSLVFSAYSIYRLDRPHAAGEKVLCLLGSPNFST
jgi:hypothetical protein